MNNAASKLFAVFALLLGVWVVTYWLYEPRSSRAPAMVAIDSQPVAAPPKITLDPPQPATVPSPGALATAPQPSLPVATQPTVKLEPPQFREYTVRKGDTSWQKIAARPEVFSDSGKWQAVAKANPLVSPDRLKPGKTVLKIPLDPDNIQGRLVQVNPDGSTLPAAQPITAQPSPASTTYTVTRDDSLWSISKKVYGKGSLWRTIYEANRSQIKNPDRPPAGAVLTIPPAPQ